jgi:hypothetical protein
MNYPSVDSLGNWRLAIGLSRFALFQHSQFRIRRFKSAIGNPGTFVVLLIRSSSRISHSQIRLQTVIRYLKFAILGSAKN